MKNYNALIGGTFSPGHVTIYFRPSMSEASPSQGPDK